MLPAYVNSSAIGNGGLAGYRRQNQSYGGAAAEDYSNYNEPAYDGSDAEVTSSLDAFKEWLEKLFDWIEVRLNRVQWQIDFDAQKAENAVGYILKNSYVNNQMGLIGTGKESYSLQKTTGDDGVSRIVGIDYSGGTNGTLLYDNMRGARRYLEQAQQIRNQAVNMGVISGTEADTIIGLIQSGKIDIAEYDEEQRDFISSYQEWWIRHTTWQRVEQIIYLTARIPLEIYILQHRHEIQSGVNVIKNVNIGQLAAKTRTG